MHDGDTAGLGWIGFFVRSELSCAEVGKARVKVSGSASPLYMDYLCPCSRRVGGIMTKYTHSVN